MAADDQVGDTPAARTDAIPVPNLPDLLQHLVQAAATALGLDAAGLVVVVATAEPNPEREAAVGERLQAE